jgi:multiple sugar transport system permease protein
MAGYAFARLRFPGRDKIFLLYLSTMMIPFAVRMIPLFVLMRTFGWVDSLQALYIPGMFSAWATFLMRQFMITIPRELEDAAFIDGATRPQIYWKIIIPLTKPALATLGIFHFLGSWNAFLWPIIILSSMANRTLPLGLAAFQAMSALKTPWHLIMAASVVSILPVLVIFILGQKYYVRGIVTTGLKG